VEQRFSEAAERWGRAVLLQHGPSHAHVSSMLIEGRPGVAVDKKRGFELAAAGAVQGCAHQQGCTQPLLRCGPWCGRGQGERACAGKGERSGGQLLWADGGWSVL
jgi:hypothetical protein